MARQPQPQDGSSSRQQSAPINIVYGEGEEQPRYWREEQHRWQQRREEEEEDDDDQLSENSDHDGEEEADEDERMMMQNGFSGGVIEPPEEAERRKKADVAERPQHQQLPRHVDEAIRRQKIAEMDDDLFEQLLAENERKLRQLISYVENVHLVLQ